jgi:hypothetical protein
MKGAKTGGRQKGTPNRLTTTVRETLEEMGCNPIQGMARIAMNPKASLELQGRMYAELAQYEYPKRKAIEHSGPAGAPIGVSVSATDEFTSRIISLATRLRASGTDRDTDRS